MKKTVKKVDVKAEAKVALSKVLVDAAIAAGYEVKDGSEFGLTKGSFIVVDPATDVQVKLISPKAGMTRYEVPAEAVEADEAASN